MNFPVRDLFAGLALHSRLHRLPAFGEQKQADAWIAEACEHAYKVAEAMMAARGWPSDDFIAFSASANHPAAATGKPRFAIWPLAVGDVSGPRFELMDFGKVDTGGNPQVVGRIFDEQYANEIAAVLNQTVLSQGAGK